MNSTKKSWIKHHTGHKQQDLRLELEKKQVDSTYNLYNDSRLCNM